MLKHWTSTQKTISLSSAEAEAKAITKGVVEGIYAQQLFEQQGFGKLQVQVYTDSTGAKAISKRLGPGKRAKHLEVQTYWVQQVQREGLINTLKIGTAENCADVLTKYVPRSVLDYLCGKLGYKFPGEIDLKHEPYEKVKGRHWQEKGWHWKDGEEEAGEEQTDELNDFRDKSDLLTASLLRRGVEP